MTWIEVERLRYENEHLRSLLYQAITGTHDDPALVYGVVLDHEMGMAQDLPAPEAPAARGDQ